MGTEKFKIWVTIAWGYKYAFRNIPAIFRVGWFPMAVVCLGFFSVPYVILLEFEGLKLGTLFLGTLAAGYFAVQWHRKILLNDQRSIGVSIGRPEIAYCAFLLVLNFFNAGVGLVLDFLGLSSASIIQTIFVWTILILLSVSIPMILPAIAVDDRKMTLERAWRLWQGNRTRFFLFILFGGALFGVIWALVIQANSLLSSYMASLLQMDFQKVPEYGTDFAKLMFSYGATSPILTIIMFVLFAGTIGALLFSYAGIARHAMGSDIDYQPPKELRVRLGV